MLHEPLKVTSELIKCISKRSESAKINSKGCKLLSSLGKRALTSLKKCEDEVKSHIEALSALNLANGALIKALDAIFDCCIENRFSTLPKRARCSSALEEASTELYNAVSKMPLDKFQIATNTRSEFDELLKDLHNAEFNDDTTDDQKTVPTSSSNEAASQGGPEVSGADNKSKRVAQKKAQIASFPDPISLAIRTVAGIVSHGKEAKTNQEGC